jgi:hypothetical protein
MKRDAPQQLHIEGAFAERPPGSFADKGEGSGNKSSSVSPCARRSLNLFVTAGKSESESENAHGSRALILCNMGKTALISFSFFEPKRAARMFPDMS